MPTFLTVFNDLETIVKEGDARILEGLANLDRMAEQLDEGDEVSQMNAVQAREKAAERRRFIFFLGARLQSQLKLLQHHCFDNSIPAEAPVMWTPSEAREDVLPFTASHSEDLD